ncbi:MAG TPA: hypothetical protein VFV67_33475 [Actinophytocola sp.]|uniref:hypothetical protein n=1 Tax=Actinophytocola sp. TaxID=1872138 RepID=UPI002DB76454|nr:hypothetical protein [Actinophytocola sp.]HEU5475579.1 hypothetical protein [Actinophytocola sp.]
MIDVAPPLTVLPPELEQADWWTDEMVFRAGIPMYDVPFVSVGGGMGSFVTVDYLRVAGGVPASDIRVLSNLSHPWQTYEYLTRVSQLPRSRRIRSDSSSRPDNLWGFPSYAIQEAVRDRTVKPVKQVLLEPVFADFYTPLLGMVLDSMRREAQRIRYWDMLVQGEVRTVRRRAGGGYFAVQAPRPNQPNAPASGLIAYRCRDVHVAVGYTGLRFLPDLQRFREQHNDYHHVVNGYEDHEHVYESLRRRPGTVLIRGSGIVTSAVLQRLICDRLHHGAQTRIVQIIRTYVKGAHGRHAWSRRPGSHGFAYQGFNYPKSAWGGQLKARMRRREGADRVQMYDEIGGTTTPLRRLWQHHLQNGRREGWYTAYSGKLDSLGLASNGQVKATLHSPEGDRRLRADYVIDCTGLDADVAEHRVLGDLLHHGGARRNPLGRLDVEPSFELRGSASGMGRVYVTGAASFGGYFPGVDTFLGLQISAQEVVDDIARRNLCRRMGPLRSTVEWLKWARNRQI